jgi:hypothetical protein
LAKENVEMLEDLGMLELAKENAGVIELVTEDLSVVRLGIPVKTL